MLIISTTKISIFNLSQTIFNFTHQPKNVHPNIKNNKHISMMPSAKFNDNGKYVDTCDT